MSGVHEQVLKLRFERHSAFRRNGQNVLAVVHGNQLFHGCHPMVRDIEQVEVPDVRGGCRHHRVTQVLLIGGVPGAAGGVVHRLICQVHAGHQDVLVEPLGRADGGIHKVLRIPLNDGLADFLAVDFLVPQRELGLDFPENVVRGLVMGIASIPLSIDGLGHIVGESLEGPDHLVDFVPELGSTTGDAGTGQVPQKSDGVLVHSIREHHAENDAIGHTFLVIGENPSEILKDIACQGLHPKRVVPGFLDSTVREAKHFSYSL